MPMKQSQKSLHLAAGEGARRHHPWPRGCLRTSRSHRHLTIDTRSDDGEMIVNHKRKSAPVCVYSKPLLLLLAKVTTGSMI
jgi:hypothetical protein